MKKVIICLVMAISFLIVKNVYADTAAPGIISFDVYVSNLNGASLYDIYDGKVEKVIPYNTKLSIRHSVFSGGKLFYEVFGTDIDGYVLKDDITIIKQELKKEEGSSIRQVSFKVFEKDGINLYKGPSNHFFDKVEDGLIPYGTVITSDTKDIDDGVWYYVTYNGKSGWISTWKSDTDNDMIGWAIDENIMLIGKQTKLYEDNLKTYSVMSTKENEIVKALYKVYMGGFDGNYYYVEYNGKTGWINRTEVSEPIMKAKKIRILKNVDVYDTQTQDVKVDSIPANTEVMSIATYYDRSKEVNHIEYMTDYIEYNGKKGWVSLSNSDYEIVGEIVENPNVSDENKVENKNPNPAKETKKIIFLCVGGAVILALTSAVTITLVNKKSKNQNN